MEVTSFLADPTQRNVCESTSNKAKVSGVKSFRVKSGEPGVHSQPSAMDNNFTGALPEGSFEGSYFSNEDPFAEIRDFLPPKTSQNSSISSPSDTLITANGSSAILPAMS